MLVLFKKESWVTSPSDLKPIQILVYEDLILFEESENI